MERCSSVIVGGVDVGAIKDKQLIHRHQGLASLGSGGRTFMTDCCSFFALRLSGLSPSTFITFKAAPDSAKY